MEKKRIFGKNKSNSKYAACHALPLDTLSTGLTSNMSGKKCATESCSDDACARSLLPVSSAPLNAALCLSCNVSVLRGNDSDDSGSESDDDGTHTPRNLSKEGGAWPADDDDEPMVPGSPSSAGFGTIRVRGPS